MNAGHVEPALNFLIGVSDEVRREGRSRKGRETKSDTTRAVLLLFIDGNPGERIDVRKVGRKSEERKMKKDVFSYFCPTRKERGRKRKRRLLAIPAFQRGLKV